MSDDNQSTNLGSPEHVAGLLTVGPRFSVKLFCLAWLSGYLSTFCKCLRSSGVRWDVKGQGC